MGCGTSKASVSPSGKGPAALEAAGKRGLAPLLEFIRQEDAIPSSSTFAGLDEKHAASWLNAVHACVDSVWSPLIAELERLSEHLASSYGVEAGTARFLATTATVFCLLLDTDIDSAST